MIHEEEITHEILEEYFKEQDRLIAEGKIQRPQQQVIYGISEEGQKIVKEGWTLEKVINEIEGRKQ